MFCEMQIAPHYIILVACFWMFIHMFIYKEIAIYDGNYSVSKNNNSTKQSQYSLKKHVVNDTRKVYSHCSDKILTLDTLLMMKSQNH